MNTPMAKSDLLDRLVSIDEEYEDEFLKTVNDFYKANIVIPRGENPHPDSELLHRLFENTALQVQSKHDIEFLWSDMVSIFETRFRIKPDDAEIEYQYDIEGFGISVRTNQFYTEDMAKLCLNHFASYTKVEETGRPKSGGEL